MVIPCLNEAENIEACVRAALEAIVRMGVHGEVVVADNNSEDDSARLAEQAGARVVVERRRGYGSAYLAGFEASRGRYIVMADADLTYDFEEIPRFVAALEEGAEMVIGDRMDNIQPGAMTWSHRYIGNPILTGLLNLFFRTGISDAHCGMRALRREVLPRLDLRTTGMEFASEMVIRASKEKLKIAEFPIEYHPRGGESKLSTIRDGWRHLRFLLVHSPNHLFIIPGAVLAGLGTLIVVLVGAGLDFFGRAWGVHALIGGALLMIVGTQVLALGLCAHAYGTYFMGERDPWFDRMRARFRLEHGLLLGGAVHAHRRGHGRPDPGNVDRPRLRLARRRTPSRDRCLGADRRDTDLLLVFPAVDSRAAAQSLIGVKRRAAISRDPRVRSAVGLGTDGGA